MMQRSQ